MDVIPKREAHNGTAQEEAVARVRILPGNGNITINKRSIDEYFGREVLHYRPQPLVLTNTENKYDVIVNVHGSSTTGQGAIRHGMPVRFDR